MANPYLHLIGVDNALDEGTTPVRFKGILLEFADETEFRVKLKGLFLEFGEEGSLPPSDPVLATVDATQLTGDPAGRTEINLYWSHGSGGGTIDHHELYRIPGNLPLPVGSDYATVTGYGGVVLVDDTLTFDAEATSEILPQAASGETWTYYLFACGATENSTCDAVMVETITTIPQTLTVGDIGDRKVRLNWAVAGDDNLDGYNVYRCDGGSFDPATCVQVNSVLVTSGVFLDGAANTTNRRPVGEVPLPVNGQSYAYKVESEDQTTSWTTGTQNQSADPLKSAVTTAEKNA